MQPDEAGIVGDGKTRLYAVFIHSSKRGESHSKTARFQYFNIGKELDSVSATLHSGNQHQITNSLGQRQERHNVHRHGQETLYGKRERWQRVTALSDPSLHLQHCNCGH